MKHFEIKNWRVARRLKQGDLAKIIGIRPETMSRMERGADAVPAYVELILALIDRGGEEALKFAMERRGLLQAEPKTERENEHVE